MNASPAYPIQILQEHVTGLEAALSVCLAEPGHRPVHRLRTETRRVGALLLLLGLIPELPEHRTESAALMRALGRLRRAAGKVRDLDVHRKMLETLTQEEARSRKEPAGEIPDSAAAAVNGNKAQAKAKRAGKAASESETAETGAGGLSQPASELRKELGHERDKAADALQEILRKRQAKTARAAEKLLAKLETVRDFALPGPELLRDAEALLARSGMPGKGPITKLSKGELHTIRKAAKTARYLAESLPEDATLVAAARGFEALQEAGGQWHDAMELARAARRYFGKGHALTVAFREDRDRKLESYRHALEARATPGRPGKLAKAAQGQSKKRPIRADGTAAGKAAVTAA